MRSHREREQGLETYEERMRPRETERESGEGKTAGEERRSEGKEKLWERQSKTREGFGRYACVFFISSSP